MHPNAERMEIWAAAGTPNAVFRTTPRNWRASRAAR